MNVYIYIYNIFCSFVDFWDVFRESYNMEFSHMTMFPVSEGCIVRCQR